MMPAWVAAPWLRYAVVVLIVAGSAWTARGWLAEAENTRQQAAYSEERLAAANAASSALQAMLKERDEADARFAAAETEQYRRLRDAEKENERLRADVDTGRQRLRVRAVCSGGDGVPEASTVTSVGHGATAELDPAARQDYFALRAGIERVTRQLGACQARLR